MKFLLLGLLLQCSLPLKHLALTSGYGYRIHPITKIRSFHAGIDLKANHDTVYAIANASVSGAGYQPFLGGYIKLDHKSLLSVYGHLSQVFVQPGDTVYAGEAIALSGSTGRVTGEHLHFAVYFRGKPIDPVKFLIQLF